MPHKTIAAARSVLGASQHYPVLCGTSTFPASGAGQISILNLFENWFVAGTPSGAGIFRRGYARQLLPAFRLGGRAQLSSWLKLKTHHPSRNLKNTATSFSLIHALAVFQLLEEFFQPLCKALWGELVQVLFARCPPHPLTKLRTSQQLAKPVTQAVTITLGN